MQLNTSILKTLPLISDLTEIQAAELLSVSQYHACIRGNYVYVQGEKIEYLYLLYRGVVHTFRGALDGRETTSEILAAKECVNPDELFTSKKFHQLNALAIEDVRVLKIPMDWIRQSSLLADLLPKLLAILTLQLHRSQKDADQHSTMSSTQIVACYLQELCVQYGYNPAGFELPYSKTLIASRLRMELETFSRTLKGLRGVGVGVDGAYVSLTDLDKLKAFVCDKCSVADECPSRAGLSAFPRRILAEDDLGPLPGVSTGA